MSPDAGTALAAVRARIADACARSGREPDAVRLVAVSKTFAADRIRDLLSRGHDLFGENRVQEALDKIPAVGQGARWHLIGHLQRNKARHAVGTFELIHGVDSKALAEELARRAASAGRRQAILIQVNVGDEASKAGVPVADLPSLVDAIGALDALELQGLMAIPPPPVQPDDSRRWFARLRALRDVEARRSGQALPELSMGMTDDFEVAIEEGATLVRVGRALFGARESAG